MKKVILIIFSITAVLTSQAQLAGFTLNGNPQSSNGATWTFQDTVNNVWYDLQGILFEPQTGTPPYPAVIINHGTGGNVNGYSKSVALKMVQWGFVCIATNLCHSAGAPVGSPGDTSFANYGASTNNYLRDMKCCDILASLNYVDTNCIMAFGHSRGAYTTTGLVASYPGKFICAGHTAGGATMQAGFSAPTTALAAQITCPYIIHHGDADGVVPIAMDSVLNNVFDSTGIIHQFYVYPGYSHSQMSMDSLMFVRTHDWFLNHSCLAASAIEVNNFEKDISIFPNPVANEFTIYDVQNTIYAIEIYNVIGKKIFLERLTSVIGHRTISIADFPSGIYFADVLFNDSSIKRIKFIKE